MTRRTEWAKGTVCLPELCYNMWSTRCGQPHTVIETNDRGGGGGALTAVLTHVGEHEIARNPSGQKEGGCGVGGG